MATGCTSNCYYDVLSLIDGIEANSNYSLTLFPNYGSNRPMYIFVYFVLVKLMELMNGGSFAVAGTLITFWYDPNLAWSKSAHNNVSNLEIPTSSIWRPTLVLINSISGATVSLDSSSLSTVDYDGKVTTVFPKIFNATCPIDITYFPFDTQTCTLSIGNTEQGHRASENILFVPAFNSVNTEIMMAGSEFTYVGSNVSSGYLNLKRLNFLMPVVNMTFTFKRNPAYYLINVAMPSLILLFSAGLIFFLPSDNSVKIAMACSLLMALYVLQQAISRVLPTTPTVPLLATGIMIELGLGCYSVLCAVVTVSLRALQPPLCPCCVKLIKAVERVFFDAPSTTQSDNIAIVGLIETIHDSYYSNALAAPQAGAHANTNADQLTDAVTTLVKTLTTQAQLKEAEKLKQAEHARHWKVLDLMLNFILFFIYLAISTALCLKYLFGIGI